MKAHHVPVVGDAQAAGRLQKPDAPLRQPLRRAVVAELVHHLRSGSSFDDAFKSTNWFVNIQGGSIATVRTGRPHVP